MNYQLNDKTCRCVYKTSEVKFTRMMSNFSMKKAVVIVVVALVNFKEFEITIV